MIEYLIVEDAQERSRVEALQRGAGLRNGDKTQYWHSWIIHPHTNQQALVIETNSDKDYFTAEEISNIISQEQADIDDWFTEVGNGI